MTGFSARPRKLVVRQHGLSKRVVNEELQRLVEEGWLRSVPRVGTFVKGATASGGHFLQDSVVVLSADSRQPMLGQRLPGWLSYITVGAIREIEAHGLHAVLLNPGKLCGEVVERLIKERPMGVVIPETVRTSSVLEYGLKLRASQVPVIFNSGEDTLEEFDRVASDAEAGGYALTRWLLARGRRHIRMAWPEDIPYYWARERRRGYERAMREAGLVPPPSIKYADFGEQHEISRNTVSELARVFAPYFAEAIPMDGVLVASDGPVSQVEAACRELGKMPGLDVDLTGYDNYWQDLAACGYPSVRPSATVDRNNEEIGAEMVRLVMRRAEERARGKRLGEPMLRKVAPRLVVTTAPVIEVVDGGISR